MDALTLYSRQGCHLCEEMIEALLPIIRGRVELRVVDIDTDTELQARYGLRVPVLTGDGALICEGRLDSHSVYGFLSNPGAFDRR